MKKSWSSPVVAPAFVEVASRGDIVVAAVAVQHVGAVRRRRAMSLPSLPLMKSLPSPPASGAAAGEAR